MPVSDRNPSAQAVSVHGRLFLVDCGEGTQQQLRRHHVGMAKIEAVFLSHIHGDHMFGIWGLLSSLSLYGRTAPLPIYAPQAFGGQLANFLSYHGEGIAYPVEHRVLKCSAPTVVHENKHVRVSAFPLRHKIECYGFRFDELLPAARPRPEGVPAGVERKPVQPRSYAYCSDTMPFPELPGWVQGVDLLYHEATYPQAYADKACQYFHSTTLEAAACAREAGARRLIVGHYSSRVRDAHIYEEECRSIFAESYAADDGDVFEIPYIRTL